jgi:hypothetical protein
VTKDSGSVSAEHSGSVEPTGPAEPDAAEKRHDQLTSAPKSTEADAAPRIEVSEHDGTTRVDIRDDAAFRPGAP